MSDPQLHPAMYLCVSIGTGIDRVFTKSGTRIDYPILGGYFVGPGLDGEILLGGVDYYLEREDGTGVLNAHYRLRCNDGAIIGVHNRGLLVLSEDGHLLARDTWPIPESEYCCRCTPQFTTDNPRYQWLMQHLFVGVVTYPSEHRVGIKCYRVD